MAENPYAKYVSPDNPYAKYVSPDNPYAKYVSPDNPYAKYTGQQPKQDGGLGQYLSETASNVGPNAMNLAKGLFIGLPVAAAKGVAKTVTNPIGTAGDVGGALGQFVWRSLTNPAGSDPISDAVVGYLTTKYGSVEKAKETFRTEPLGVVLDVAPLVTGAGGAARGIAGHMATNAAKTGTGVAAKVPTVNMGLNSTKKAEKAAIQLDMAEGPQVQKAVNAAATVTPAVKAARTTKAAKKIDNAGQTVQMVGDAFNPILAPVNVLKTVAKVPGLSGISQVGLNALALPGETAGKVGNALANAGNKKVAKVQEYLGNKLHDVNEALGPKVGGGVANGSIAVSSPVPAEALRGAAIVLSNPDAFLSEVVRNAQRMLASSPSSIKGGAVVDGSTVAREAAEIVPGTVPNAAEAASDAGSVGLAKLQDKVSRANTNVSQMTRDQGKANDKALLEHVGTFAKTPADITEAVTKRQGDFDSTYRKAKAGHAPGKHEQLISGYGKDDRLAKLMERPAIKEAFDSAEFNAKNSGVRVFEDIPVTGFKGDKPKNAGKLTGEGVHRVKVALDEMIQEVEKAKNNPNISSEQIKHNLTSLKDAKRDFLAWAEEYIPEYGEARRGFREASVPINQMEVGQYIQGELKKILENKKLDAAGRAEAFAKVMDDAPKILKNSMGEARFHRLEDVFDRSQLMKIKNVQDHLDRAKSVEVDASKAFDAKDTSVHLNEGIPTSARGVLLHTVNQLMKLGKGRISEKTATELALALKDSASARKLIADTINTLEKRKARGAAVKKVNEVIKRTPAANALGPQEDENRNALSR